MRLLRVLIGAGVFAAGTALGGWWVLAVVAAVWGRWRPGVAEPAAAAGLAWAALVAWQILQGPSAAWIERLSALFGLPVPVVLAAAPVFAMLLAGAAAGAFGRTRGER